ncbi:arginyl-tRNA--protein transferase 1-like [Dreissena polymorpha]|uniref:arginyl-tRNA--protein transferase 1-like n=1 Tax=Dreissena polymorpha TaxID=45954 RepID=UPI0022646400|nr:arginyl-tRNA--protein transferase 1-like [Dreissena polymorpha]
MAANSNVSVVEYFSENERYRCGYCGCADTNYSHGMWAHSMTVQDYQDLLDRGWRRSGKYCYKPTMKQTCCPLYTIRCEVLNFKLRKSQKKVLKKVNKYLIEGIKPTSDKDDDNPLGDQDDFVDGENQSEQNPGTQAATLDQEHIAEDLSGSEKEHKVPRKGTGPDPTKPPCKKAKELRRERKLAKMANKIDGTSASETAAVSSIKGKQAGKTLEDYISEPSKAAKCAHKLEIKLVRSGPQSSEFQSSYSSSYDVYKRYQMAVHGDDEKECSKRAYDGFLVETPLEVLPCCLL